MQNCNLSGISVNSAEVFLTLAQSEKYVVFSTESAANVSDCHEVALCSHNFSICQLFIFYSDLSPNFDQKSEMNK